MQYKLLFAALAAAQLTLAAPVPAPEAVETREEGIYTYYAPPKERREEGIYTYYAPPKEKREEGIYTYYAPPKEKREEGIYTYYAPPKAAVKEREAEAAPEAAAEEVS
jgi:hypothetical protein